MSKKRSDRTARKYRAVTVEEINVAMAKEKDLTVEESWAVFFTVLFDKHGFDLGSASRVWDEVERVSAQIENDGDISDMQSKLEAQIGEMLDIGGYIAKGPLTQLELHRAKRWTKWQTRNISSVIFLAALKRAENPDGALLRKVYDECLYYWDSLDTGKIKAQELHKALDEEAKIQLV